MVRVLMAAAILAGFGLPVHAGSLLLTPSVDTSALGIGDRFSLRLSTDDAFADLMGGVFNVHYDADVVTYEGASFSNPPFIFNNHQAAEAVGASGETTIANVSFSAFLTSTGGGAIDIATLEFAAVGVGSTDIEITEGATGFTGPAGNIDVTYPAGTEAVVTPVPAALPLLASALAGLGILHVRRRRLRA